jgi:sugar phosphate isomerase/epimerase
MYKPKYSVILPNYLSPKDRFADYGGVNKSSTELINVCGKQGAFHGVEMIFSDDEPSINPRNMKAIQSALIQNGLSLAGIIANTYSGEFKKGSLSSPDPKVRRTAIDLVKRTIDIAAELCCPYVGQWPGQDGWDFYFEVDYQKAYEWWVEGMQILADYNPEIKLGIEPKPYEPRSFSLVDTSAKVLMMLKDINRSNVGLTLDIGHSIYGHESMAEAVALAQMDNRLFHLHMNDNYGDMDWDMPFGSVHLQGYIELFYWLMRTNYNGYLSVDIFAYRTGPAETIFEGQMWMQAIFELIEKTGMEELDQLIVNGDGIDSQRFLRELIFGKRS